ncbi:MAG: hypothetical protein J6R88_03125 [Clostridia bacterium]|nr:hypothetical protein [Clostridia bacterium]
MNCLDKMYKEIEEILKKEEQERLNELRPIKEIKHGFSSSFDSVEEVIVAPVYRNYLSEISLDGKDYVKKYFNEEKAKVFINFIFKKYLCFNGDGVVSNDVNEFFKSVETKTANGDLITILTELENEFIDLFAIPNDEAEEYFLNPYNALFKDENGYYAVIEGNKYSNVRRPIGYNFNQMRKVVKEVFDAYAEDFKPKFNSEKELIAFMNGFKAEINKADFKDPISVMAEFENKFFMQLEKKGVTKPNFDEYVNKKGLQIIKQGNFYFHKKAYENYAEYKKIEFRY